MIKNIFSRFIDIVFSIIFIIFFFWLYIFLIIFIKFRIGSPVFFKQKRLGLNGKIFYLIKFRTFKNNKIIKKVAFLRKYKLDEIPQILNILKGDMSIVGPRPLKIDYFKFINKNFKLRLRLKPGLTGMVQINPHIKDWSEYFEKDLEYIKKKTFLLDLKIVLITIFSLNSYKSSPQLIDLNQYLKKRKLKKYI